MNRSCCFLPFVFVLIACSIPSLVHGQAFANQHKFFVDSNLVFETGTKLSKSFLKESEPEFSKRLPSLNQWVVRVEVRHSITAHGFQSNHGTGVVLEDGQVLTARHVLEQNINDDATEKLEILLTTNEGRVARAVAGERGELDWALLEIETPDNKANGELSKDTNDLFKSPIKIASPKPESTLVFVGYPARLGLDSEGVARAFNDGNADKKIPVSRLDPCLIVGKIKKKKAELDFPGSLYLEPIAGFPPAGGMSGGPIFDLSGAVVGIQVGVTKTTADATGEVLVYGVNAISTTAMNSLHQ